MRRNVLQAGLLAVLVMGTALSACAEETAFTPGTYSDTQQGLGGDVTVTITTDENSITDVQITGDKETPEIGGAAIETLIPSIMDAQSAEVEAVAGATVTSDAVIKAA